MMSYHSIACSERAMISDGGGRLKGSPLGSVIFFAIKCRESGIFLSFNYYYSDELISCSLTTSERLPYITVVAALGNPDIAMK